MLNSEPWLEDGSVTLLRFTSQQLLGERWALIGTVSVFADEDDAPAKSQLSKFCGDGRAGQARSDYDDGLRHALVVR